MDIKKVGAGKPILYFINEYMRNNIYFHALFTEVLEQRHILSKIVFTYPSFDKIIDKEKYEKDTDGFQNSKVIEDCILDRRNKKFRLIQIRKLQTLCKTIYPLKPLDPKNKDKKNYFYYTNVYDTITKRDLKTFFSSIEFYILHEHVISTVVNIN